jgi:hypothetical protein
MAKLEDLQSELERMRAILVDAGLLPKQKPEHNHDYIAHGSMEYAAMIGLVAVSDTELDQAKRDGYTVYISPKTKQAWRLEDEIGALRFYPGVEPKQACLVVLRQKVNGLESGPPRVPANAPPMFNPESYSG